MIKRIWHGWTRPEHANAYEALVRDEIFPGIAEKSGQGFMGAELLRLEEAREVEFMTVMSFDSLATIERLAGEHVTRAYIPEKARALLSHWDECAQHFQTRVEIQT